MVLASWMMNNKQILDKDKVVVGTTVIVNHIPRAGIIATGVGNVGGTAAGQEIGHGLDQGLDPGRDGEEIGIGLGLDLEILQIIGAKGKSLIVIRENIEIETEALVHKIKVTVIAMGIQMKMDDQFSKVISTTPKGLQGMTGDQN